jgi:O-antigen ligase
LLAVVILTGAVSYLFKIMLGKRTFSFRPLDLTVLLLGLMYVLSTPFTHGGSASVREALLYAVLLLGYFLAANLLNTPAAISRAITALVAGGTVTALLGLYQQFAGKAVADWLDNAAYDYIAGRITAAFGNPNVLATYLILLFPFVMAGILKKGSFGSRAGSFLLFALFISTIILTWSRGAWIGVFLSLAIFLFAYNPATLYIWIPTVIGGLFALQHFDSAILNRLGSVFSPMADSSISYRISTWHGALSMASEHLLGGIGVGEEAFHATYPYYALSGIESAPHAHNLPLQYLCEFGIVGPLLLLLFIVIFFQCVISHRREETNQAFRLYSLAASSGVLAVLIFGLTDHVFYNARIFFLFFAVAGIAAALSRVGRVERERSLPISDREGEAYTIEIELSED